MRKSRIIIEGLQRRIKEAESQRDQALADLHGKTDALKAEVTKLHASIKANATHHSAALAKQGDDLAGLADAVRAAVKPAAPEPEAPKTVTPIKRGTKAAG